MTTEDDVTTLDNKQQIVVIRSRNIIYIYIYIYIMISNVGILCVESQLYLQSSTGIDFYRSIAHEISI